MRENAKAAALLFVLGLQPAWGADFELRYGFDALARSQSLVRAFNYLSLMHEVRPGLRFGQSLYSAAAGDGGGMFTGGFEISQRFPLSTGAALEIGGFLGGGGGVRIVAGDGLMSRANVTYIQPLGRDWAGTVGLSYTKISGSPISSPALSFGISKNLTMALQGGHDRPYQGPAAAVRVVAVKPMARSFLPLNSKRRDGTDLQAVQLLGAELVFSVPEHRNRAVFLQGSAAVAGNGEGYAEWQLGHRWMSRPDGFRAFAELAAGFGGGGGVDTGSGAIGSAGVGFAVPLPAGLEVEIGAAAVAALDSEFAVIAPFLRGVMNFGASAQQQQAAGIGTTGSQRKLQLSMGSTLQFSHPGFRNPRSIGTADPLLIETSLDLFLTDQSYFTINAATVIAGDAGGYAVGQFGFGYEFPLNDRWTLAAEASLGAAGGDGVDTGGGFIVGGRLEIDYAMDSGNRLSVGIGKLHSRGGARPKTLQVSIKVPFTTYH